MTIVKCNFCNNKFVIDHAIDEYPNEVTTCPHCNVGISTNLLEFVGSTEEEQ